MRWLHVNVEAIRGVDPRKAIIVESAVYVNAEGR